MAESAIPYEEYRKENPTPQQEMNYHLDRIASALESMAETNRLSYDLHIDSIAKSNALSDSMTGALGGIFKNLGIDAEED